MRRQQYLIAVSGALAAYLKGDRLHLPAGSEIVWTAFAHLSAKRSSSFTGPNPIGYGELEAYARLYRWPLEPHHVELIMAMDKVWLENVLPRSKSETAPSSQAINPGAFDAVFA